MKASRANLVIFVFIAFAPVFLQGQEQDTTRKGLDYLAYKILYQNHDTSYIKNYSDRISLKLLSNNKYNYLLTNHLQSNPEA